MGLLARAGAASVAVTFLAGGCAGGAGSARPHARAPAGRATVTLRDFRITAPRHRPAGRVRFAVSNRGPDTHELLVVRGRIGHLPMRRDGLTVDEDRLGPAVVGVVEGQAPGARHALDLALAPGHYALLCNMTGHYLGGMREELVVR
jgi:hypothetical protein